MIYYIIEYVEWVSLHCMKCNLVLSFVCKHVDMNMLHTSWLWDQCFSTCMVPLCKSKEYIMHNTRHQFKVGCNFCRGRSSAQCHKRVGWNHDLLRILWTFDPLWFIWCNLRGKITLLQLFTTIGGHFGWMWDGIPLPQPQWIEPWILLKLSECWVKLWPPEAINPSWMILIVLPMYRYVPHPNTAHSNTLQKYFSTYNVV